jgi:hypothetical protein
MDAVYERRLRLVYDALDAANWKVREGCCANWATAGGAAPPFLVPRFPRSPAHTYTHTPTLSFSLTQAAAKAAAAALAKHPGDAQLTALRSLALQRLGQEGEAVQVSV